MENAAAAARAAAPCPAKGVTTTQRQDDDNNNIMTIFHACGVSDVLEHIAGFMSTSTLLLFASAFPALSDSLVQASDKAASANGWKIIIGSTAITESGASSLPPTSTTLASKINDRIVCRMLCLVKRLLALYMCFLRRSIPLQRGVFRGMWSMWSPTTQNRNGVLWLLQ